MRDEDAGPEHAEINPAARRDRPGEPHEDLADRPADDADPPAEPRQEEPLDPLRPGGIGG